MDSVQILLSTKGVLTPQEPRECLDQTADGVTDYLLRKICTMSLVIVAIVCCPTCTELGWHSRAYGSRAVCGETVDAPVLGGTCVGAKRWGQARAVWTRRGMGCWGRKVRSHF